eukprot:TRINITY_DN2060_c0_g2_i4.p1 TRINITY_DN2060_c0_g2~~TRINITY_DN2060_c0_g2_i4.p1  ORF type:complete len:307 (+),score=54.03 TRINITY_DN2060_c0_g2_i4:203-1123(+)
MLPNPSQLFGSYPYYSGLCWPGGDTWSAPLMPRPDMIHSDNRTTLTQVDNQLREQIKAQASLNAKNTYVQKINSLIAEAKNPEKFPDKLQTLLDGGESQSVSPNKRSKRSNENPVADMPRSKIRQLKNRESARRSRKRKKVYIELLEEKVNKLELKLQVNTAVSAEAEKVVKEADKGSDEAEYSTNLVQCVFLQAIPQIVRDFLGKNEKTSDEIKETRQLFKESMERLRKAGEEFLARSQQLSSMLEEQSSTQSERKNSRDEGELHKKIECNSERLTSSGDESTLLREQTTGVSSRNLLKKRKRLL